MTEHSMLSSKPAPLDIQQWKKIISDWELTKERQRQYCERLGINLNTFTYARSKLVKNKQSKSVFVPVKINASSLEKSSNIDKIIIETPNGFKFHIKRIVG